MAQLAELKITLQNFLQSTPQYTRRSRIHHCPICATKCSENSQIQLNPDEIDLTQLFHRCLHLQLPEPDEGNPGVHCCCNCAEILIRADTIHKQLHNLQREAEEVCVKIMRTFAEGRLNEILGQNHISDRISEDSVDHFVEAWKLNLDLVNFQKKVQEITDLKAAQELPCDILPEVMFVPDDSLMLKRELKIEPDFVEDSPIFPFEDAVIKSPSPETPLLELVIPDGNSANDFRTEKSDALKVEEDVDNLHRTSDSIVLVNQGNLDKTPVFQFEDAEMIELQQDNDDLRAQPMKPVNGLSFECRYCKKQMPSIELLHNHERNHLLGEDTLYSCQFCSTTQKGRGKFIGHLEEAHLGQHVTFGDKLYFLSCDGCEHWFSSQSLLRDHINKSHASTIANCDHCDKIFADSKNCDRHIQHFHDQESTEPAHNCQYCHLDFRTYESLTFHQEMHVVVVSRTPYTCDICGMMFRNLATFRPHSRKCQSDQKEIGGRTDFTNKNTAAELCFPCKRCGKRYSNKESLEFHAVVHSYLVGLERSFRCPACPENFESTKTLRAHLKARHKFKCKICNAERANESGLRLHIRAHLIKKSKPVSANKLRCLACDTLILNARLLKLHYNKVHQVDVSNWSELPVPVTPSPQRRSRTESEPGKFHCAGCGESYGSVKVLNAHKLAHHRESFTSVHKPNQAITKYSRLATRLKCRFCKKVAKSIFKRRRHEYLCNPREYMEERQFLCDICYRTFADQEKLDLHITTHEKVNCQICNVPFTTSKGLKVHMRAHFVQKPDDAVVAMDQSIEHRCLTCDAVFEVADFLKLHYAEVHQIDVYRPDFVMPLPVLVCNRSLHFKSDDWFEPTSQLGTSSTKYRKAVTKPNGGLGLDRFSCKICGNNYGNIFALNRHKFIQHLNRGFDCKICGKFYRKPASYRTHLRTHRLKRCSKFCEQCGETLRGYIDKRLHQIKCHREEYLKGKPFYCTICYLTFATQEQLDTHIERHPKCKHCDRRCRYKWALKQHELSHMDYSLAVKQETG